MTYDAFITSLTDAQRGKLVTLADQWRALERSTEPADHDATETAFREFFSIRRWSNPTFVWCASPRAALEVAGEAGSNRRGPAKLFEAVNTESWQELWWGHNSPISEDVAIQVTEAFGNSEAANFRQLVNELKARDILPGFKAPHIFPVFEKTSAALSDPDSLEPTDASAVTHCILASVCSELFFDQLPKSLADFALGHAHYAPLLRHASWFFQYVGSTCFLSERPVAIDNLCAKYADGFEVTL